MTETQATKMIKLLEDISSKLDVLNETNLHVGSSASDTDDILKLLKNKEVTS